MQPGPELFIQFCSRGDSRYASIRRDHYVKPKGAQGQQVHFLIWYKGDVAGIISGGSAAYAQGKRDAFFGITSDNRDRVLNGIVDNTVFRLIVNEKNLATRVLSLWRMATERVWKHLYGVEVYGFETFVDGLKNEELLDPRMGTLYFADNWTHVGETEGSAKNHDGVGMHGKSKREATSQKRIFCKWVPGHTKAVEHAYQSCWKNSTAEDRERGERLTRRRGALSGLCFFKVGKQLRTSSFSPLLGHDIRTLEEAA